MPGIVLLSSRGDAHRTLSDFALHAIASHFQTDPHHVGRKYSRNTVTPHTFIVGPYWKMIVNLTMDFDVDNMRPWTVTPCCLYSHDIGIIKFGIAVLPSYREIAQLLSSHLILILLNLSKRVRRRRTGRFISAHRRYLVWYMNEII